MDESKAQTGLASGIGREFSGASLGDARLEKRLSAIATQISLKPAESFPVIFPDEADRESFYRFLRNPAVSWGKLIEPHFNQTSERAAGLEVIAIHDSSKLQFQRTSRGDLGFISQGKKSDKVNTAGFLCHFCFAISGEANAEPLGVVNVRPLRRLRKTRNTAKKRDREQGLKACEKYESSKWIDGVRESRRHLTDATSVIHVMDREADYFALMAELVKTSERFVIRVSHEKRKVEVNGQMSTISHALEHRSIVCEREVLLSKRAVPRVGTPSKTNKDRPSRKAQLTITAISVKVKRPDRMLASDFPDELAMNIVHVFEENPPPSLNPVDWKLFTTEPIETEEQVLKVVDTYRKRWTIEEFFKALKTGCSYEDRQLESFQTLMNALALMLPIAWQMLTLRHHSRSDDLERSVGVLSDVQLQILIALAKGRLKSEPNNREVLYAVANLGGHIKNNGAPGWLVIYRGLRELHAIQRGVELNTAQYVINL